MKRVIGAVLMAAAVTGCVSRPTMAPQLSAVEGADGTPAPAVQWTLGKSVDQNPKSWIAGGTVATVLAGKTLADKGALKAIGIKGKSSDKSGPAKITARNGSTVKVSGGTAPAQIEADGSTVEIGK